MDSIRNIYKKKSLSVISGSSPSKLLTLSLYKERELPTI